MSKRLDRNEKPADERDEQKDLKELGGSTKKAVEAAMGEMPEGGKQDKEVLLSELKNKREKIKKDASKLSEKIPAKVVDPMVQEMDDTDGYGMGLSTPVPQW